MKRQQGEVSLPITNDVRCREILRQIQRAAGVDPDGPRRLPMTKKSPLREETKRALRRASELAERDARLRRALTFLWR